MTLSPVERIDADVAVIGSGFAGSLVALALVRRGRRVVLLERGRHPRFAIGESSTPLANLLLEELADRYDLPQVRVFSKWGTWQRARPDVACGLKRGFTFLFHDPGRRPPGPPDAGALGAVAHSAKAARGGPCDPHYAPAGAPCAPPDSAFTDGPMHERQLMVAASPHDAVADTHWYRPAFDHALVREAQSAGALYLDETELQDMRPGPPATLDGVRRGRSVRVTASFVIDATGPRGFLHRALGLTEDRPLRWLPPTQGLYTHFEGVERWDALVPADGSPPYPVDDAALHHVFPGGWIWVLRFNNGITSAGAALTDPIAARVRARDGAPAWDRLLEMLPSVRRQFAGARDVLPFVHAPQLAFRSRQVCDDTWALLPSAAGVIDPLLSTGFPLTLLGIHRLLDALECRSKTARTASLRAYADATLAELDVTEQLVAALYACMTDVPLFKRLSLLYFAAASYSEAARRLGRSDLAPGFLLHAHRRFGPELVACAAAARTGPADQARQALLDRIGRAIEPFDVAGLLDRSRRDWYPVLASDLLENAAKLEASVDQIEALLRRSGFTTS